jgi:hypothetical protein
MVLALYLAANNFIKHIQNMKNALVADADSLSLRNRPPSQSSSPRGPQPCRRCARRRHSTWQSITALHFHVQYSLRGPFLLRRFGRAAGSGASDNALVSPMLSSEETSNTLGMKAVACYQVFDRDMGQQHSYCLKTVELRCPVCVQALPFELLQA